MLKNYIGTVEYTNNPPKSRRWMATSYGNHMALGNVSLVTALKYCVVEGAPPSRLDVLRGKR